MTPLSQEVLVRLYVRYNADIWPVQAVFAALAVLAVYLAIKPRPHGDRVIAAALALFWLWCGLAFHVVYHAKLNWAADWFAAVFIAQAALLAWIGAIRGRLHFRFERRSAIAWIGLGLALYAIAGHPLLAASTGFAWLGAPLVSVAHAPTTLFTLGLLLLCQPRAPYLPAIIPVLWSAYAGLEAWSLSLPADLALPPAAICWLLCAIEKNRRADLPDH